MHTWQLSEDFASGPIYVLIKIVVIANHFLSFAKGVRTKSEKVDGGIRCRERYRPNRVE